MRTFLLQLVGWVALLASGCGAPARVDPVEKPTRVALLRLTTSDLDQDTRVLLGMHFTPADLAAAAIELEKESPDIVVLEMPFASTGVPFNEVRGFLEVVHRDLVPKARVVGWLGDTYGGAVVAAWGLPELIVKPNSSFGPATLGARGSVGRRIMSEWRAVADEAAALSGRPIAPMATLQSGEPLFHSPPSAREVVCWSNSSRDGWVEVRKPGEWSPLTPNELLQFGFAIGVASDVNQIARALGLAKFELVGEQANAAMQSKLTAALRADSNMRRLLEEYGAAAVALIDTPMPIPESSQRFVTTILDELATLIDLSPSVAQGHELDSDWIASERRRLRRPQQDGTTP